MIKVIAKLAPTQTKPPFLNQSHSAKDNSTPDKDITDDQGNTGIRQECKSPLHNISIIQLNYWAPQRNEQIEINKIEFV